MTDKVQPVPAQAHRAKALTLAIQAVESRPLADPGGTILAYAADFADYLATGKLPAALIAERERRDGTEATSL